VFLLFGFEDIACDRTKESVSNDLFEDISNALTEVREHFGKPMHNVHLVCLLKPRHCGIAVTRYVGIAIG